MDEDEIRLLQERLMALRRQQRRQDVPIGGLTQSAVRVLGALSRAGESAQPAWLAAETRMTSSNVAAALRELAAGGLVERVRDDLDARRVNVTLTPSGAATLAESRGIRRAWLARAIEARLSPAEQELLVRASELLGRLCEYEDLP